MHTEPQKEHQWLDQLIGEWVMESECSAGSDQPSSKNTGTERVRSLGGLWTVGEGEGELPDGGIGKTIITLGYDPQQNRYVGTFVGSMMTHLWLYNGTLDATGKVLTLDTEGPNFEQSGMTKYKDIIEVVSADHRMLTSQILTADGQWVQFMTAHYHRKK
jgi:Protein of unknown function (DUF1579)